MTDSLDTTSDAADPATTPMRRRSGGRPPQPPGGVGRLLLLAAVGGAVALALGTYGRVHTPTGDSITTLGFSAVLPMKAWVTTAAMAFGLLQLVSALWMWGRLPAAGDAPAWVAPAHRWLGTAAFLCTLPIAYHCLWSLGFRDTDTRVLVHSILGCAFYGAFVTKMLALRSNRLPSWSIPVVGGALVAVLTGIWMTSSLWYFTNIAFPGF